VKSEDVTTAHFNKWGAVGSWAQKAYTAFDWSLFHRKFFLFHFSSKPFLRDFQKICYVYHTEMSPELIIQGKRHFVSRHFLIMSSMNLGGPILGRYDAARIINCDVSKELLLSASIHES